MSVKREGDSTKARVRTEKIAGLGTRPAVCWTKYFEASSQTDKTKLLPRALTGRCRFLIFGRPRSLGSPPPLSGPECTSRLQIKIFQCIGTKDITWKIFELLTPR